MMKAATYGGIACPSCARAHQPAEVVAVDVLHREQQALVAVVRELVDLDDVRVVEARREVRLLDEHRRKRRDVAWAGRMRLTTRSL
jgi:hypothetical protein